MNVILTERYKKSLSIVSVQGRKKVEKVIKILSTLSSFKNFNGYKVLRINEKYLNIRVDISLRIIVELSNMDMIFHYVGSHDNVIKWIKNNAEKLSKANNKNDEFNGIESVVNVTRYKLIDKSITNKEIYNVGTIPNGNFFYKYMDLESALLSLQNFDGKSTLRFVEPTSWDDEYEGRFYNANYRKVNNNDESKNPFLYACCMTTKSENEAAWMVYKHNRKGLASHCVEFKLNRRKLREQIMKSERVNGSKVYLGCVSYLAASTIDNIHEPIVDNENNPLYHDFFDNFNLYNYISLLLLKRLAYQHEEEVRIFIIPDSQQEKYQGKRLSKKGDSAKQIFVDIDWIDVIDKVSIDKDCSDFEKKLLQNLIYGILEKKKDLYTEEEYNKKKELLELKPFDVYNDSREKQIEIKANSYK